MKANHFKKNSNVLSTIYRYIFIANPRLAKMEKYLSPISGKRKRKSLFELEKKENKN